jgi:hypothetical protein
VQRRPVVVGRRSSGQQLLLLLLLLLPWGVQKAVQGVRAAPQRMHFVLGIQELLRRPLLRVLCQPQLPLHLEPLVLVPMLRLAVLQR